MRSISAFGFISGLATTSCFLLPTIALGLVIIFDLDSKVTTTLLISFVIVTRLLGDWLFWRQMFPQEMDSENNLKDWRSSVKDIIFSHPAAIRSMLDMFIDIVTDGLLIYVALNLSMPPLWIFLAFLGCQAVVAPIQGIVVDRLDKRKCQVFFMIVTVLATVFAMGIKGSPTPGFYVRLFGLDHFTSSAQMLIILLVKWLFVGTTILGKTVIASCIQIETEKKFN
jgi:hypothetical protein